MHGALQHRCPQLRAAAARARDGRAEVQQLLAPRSGTVTVTVPPRQVPAPQSPSLHRGWHAPLSERKMISITAARRSVLSEHGAEVTSQDGKTLQRVPEPQKQLCKLPCSRLRGSEHRDAAGWRKVQVSPPIAVRPLSSVLLHCQDTIAPPSQPPLKFRTGKD